MGGRPGTSFVRQAQRAVPGIPTDVGQTFLVGFAKRGPVGAAVRVDDLDGFEDTYGDGIGGVYPTLHSSVELVFGEGGGTVYVSRVAGPAKAKATLTLDIAGAVAGLRVDALDEGAWGNDVSVANTLDAGASTLVVSYLGQVVETYSGLADTAATAVALATSDYVRGTQLAAGDLVTVADTDLAGGTDDTASATDASWAAALDAFSYELGPGQVLAPGRTTSAAHLQLREHTAARNRVPLLGAPNAASKASLLGLAAATAAHAAPWGGIFGFGVALGQRVAGVDRVVPGEAFAAGLIARSDQLNDPNTWPIGTKGQRRSYPGNGLAAYARAATVEFSDDDRSDLTAAGVNVALDDANGLRLYGFRATTSGVAWQNLGHQRLYMAIQAQSDRIAEGFVGEQITAAVVARWHQALEGVLYGYYQSGALFGGFVEPSADQAYRVVTAAPVNTADTAAARELNARSYVRASEHAELVMHISSKVPVTSPVS